MEKLSLPEALFQSGFTDLVSVIPPGSQLVPSSRIPQTHIGKIPGRRVAGGLWAGYPWQKYVPSAADVHQWSIDGASFGIKADRFPGVDIDCTDPGLAQVIEDAAIAKLGAAPVRIGRAPKRLLMYRTDVPFGRMRLYIERDGKQHLVEILGQGQQYLVYGVHPTTMQPYAWFNKGVEEFMHPLLDPDDGAEALTPITREQASAFMDYLALSLSMLGVGKIEREGDGAVSERAAGTPQAGLLAPSIDALREAMQMIPNNNDLFPDRESYIKMGFAIKAASGDTTEGYEIFAEWAARWDGNGRTARNDPEVVLADWRRMRAPFAVGWSFISEQARAFGYNSAALEFDVVAEKPDDTVLGAPRYSDQWLADEVVRHQRGVLRYVPQREHYLVWTTRRWQPDAELLAEDIIKRELRRIADRCIREGTTEKEQRESRLLAERICSAGKVTAVASLIKSDRSVAVSVEALDHDAWVLNTPNGVVDLKTGELHPAHPDQLCTKMTACPADFAGACPEWERFLFEATGGDKELIAYLQRLCGYALTGSTREQQLSFIYGPGGNGKSVFLNVLSGVLGDYARVASMDTFTASYGDKHTTDIAMLTGARLVTASETQAGKRWDESRVKSLTGGEPVTARFMRQDNFTFLPQFKLVFVGNYKPEVRDIDAAMKRRIQMTPFTVTPAVVDKELAAKLRAEWPAILAWMVAGCLDWQSQGLNPPQSVKKLTEEYFTEEDAVGRWIQARCIVDPEGTELTQSLFMSWREWANQTGEFAGTMKRLHAALVSRKIERWQDTKSRRLGFKGLRLKPQEGFEVIV